MRLIRLKKESSSDDASLIRLYRQTEDNEVIGILFERYAPQVLGVCMKYLKNEDDSKDAVLQIFEKLITDLKKYDINTFSSWLHRVAKNYCFMQLRNKEALNQKNEAFREEGLFMESYAEMHQEDRFTEDLFLNKLNQAIQALPDEQKICVELFYLREESYQDIANLTGYSLNQVKSYIQNGKRNLKIYLQNIKNETARS